MILTSGKGEGESHFLFLIFAGGEEKDRKKGGKEGRRDM